MKQGRMFLPLALAALVATSVVAAAPRADAAARKSAPVATAAKKSYAFRQFTGIVTALDKSSVTIEKTGKQAETRTFALHAKLQTSGTLEKDARVTVFYRDEDGRSVAHKVVVKAAPLQAAR